MPRFSLLCITENRPEYIREAVDAVIAQDFEDWEYLIYDGGDSILGLLPQDPRIKYKHMPGAGTAARLGTVLDDAQGELRAYCWDDDAMTPGTLSFVNENIGDAQWLYGRISVGYGISGGTRWLTGQPWNYEMLKHRCIVPCPAAFWTREAQCAVGNPDVSLACIDYEYWLRLGARYTPVYTDRVMSNYRLHPGQDSNLRASQVERESAMLSRRALEGYYEKFKS